jgi:hypothetical protein
LALDEELVAMVELVRAVVVVVDVAAAELVEAELVEATVSVVVVDAVPEVVVEVVAMAPANMLISPWAGKLSPEKPDEVCSVVTVSNVRQSVVCKVTHLSRARLNPTWREGRKSRLDPS